MMIDENKTISLPPIVALKQQIAKKERELKALQQLRKMSALARAAGFSDEAFAAGVWVDVTETKPPGKPRVK